MGGEAPAGGEIRSLSPAHLGGGSAEDNDEPGKADTEERPLPYPACSDMTTTRTGMPLKMPAAAGPSQRSRRAVGPKAPAIAKATNDVPTRPANLECQASAEVLTGSSIGAGACENAATHTIPRPLSAAPVGLRRLAQADIEHHHQHESQKERHRCLAFIPSGRGFGEKLIHDHVEHRRGGERQRERQQHLGV